MTEKHFVDSPDLESASPDLETEDTGPETEEEVVEGAETEETEEGQDEIADDAGARKSQSFQERIDELTRARREAERDRDYWRQFAMQRGQEEAAPEPKAPEVPAKPKRNEFDDDDKYDEKLAEYFEALAEKKAYERTKELEQRYAQSQQQTQAQQAQKDFQRAESEFAKAVPDYFDVTSQDFPVNEPMARAIMESDSGPSIFYHLGKNQDEARRIASLSPVGAVREIGKLEAKLAKPSRRGTSAPAPPSKVGGTRGKVSSWNNLTVEQMEKKLGYRK